jgi:hypothetical protein
MHMSIISTQQSLGPNLFDTEKESLTPEQVAALWTDPDFGLQDPNNFIRWDPMVYGRDPVLYQELVNELKMKFGLLQEIIDECRFNWNEYMVDSLEFISAVVPQSDCSPSQGVAYWQWSNSFVTRKYNTPKVDSIVLVADTVTGYPEFYYFKKAKLMPSLVDRPQLQNQFKDVIMYVDDKSDEAINYEHLFDLTTPDGGDPHESSLYNIQTLTELLIVQKKVPDIIADQKIVDHLDLDIFNNLTSKLRLATNEQTYLLSLWLFYLEKYTFGREDVTKDKAYSLMANMG